VLDAVFWIACTRASWRDLPEDRGNRNSVWRQFRGWSVWGICDVLLQAWADTGGDAETLQMIDSTVVRAHVSAAGAKGGSNIRRSAAHAAASRRKSISRPISTAIRSIST
jgi:transposase